MRFLILLALLCSVGSVLTYPYYQQEPVWYSTPYRIGTGVLPTQALNPYNPYYPYYPYDWNSHNTDFYNPYNN